MMLLVAVGCGEAPVAEKHTNDVVTTLRRIVSFFPPEEHQQVRERLAENLEAVVSLRLLPNKKGTSRVPAVEIMRSTRSIQECIKDPARTCEIGDFIARGRTERMQTFDQHLIDLLRASKISVETAVGAATNPADLKTKLALEGGDPDEVSDGEKEQGPFEIEADTRF